MGEREWAYVAMAASGLPLLAYLGLFLFRTDVSLRTGPLFVLAGIFLGTRVALVAGGVVQSGSWWVLPALYAFLFVVILLIGRKPICVHAPEQAIRAEIDEACRRLFIQKEEPRPGEIHLTAKGTTAVLWLMAQSRSVTTIMLPRVRGSAKLTLFFDWLHKRYPGPIPRIRVKLDRR